MYANDETLFIWKQASSLWDFLNMHETVVSTNDLAINLIFFQPHFCDAVHT